MRMLHLFKGNAVMGLPGLKEYGPAAQLKPLICLNSPTCSSGWKEIKHNVIKTMPILVILTDIKLQKITMLTDDFHIRVLAKFIKQTKRCKVCEL